MILRIERGYLLFRGEKIREIRKQKGMTLQELADYSGLSAGLISQIERGIVDPTVSTFWKICSALNISINCFFESEDDASIVVRKNQRRIVELAGSKVRYQDLTPHAKSSNFDFILVEIQPGEMTELELISHRGEEYGFVLEGSLRVKCGEQVYDLNEGDSISFSSLTPHRYMNIGKDVSISIWAMNSR